VTAHVSEWRPRLGETDAEVLAFAIPQLRSRFESTTTEILAPIPADHPDPQVRLSVPARGEKKLLVDLATRNAKEFALAAQTKQHERKERASPALEALQKDLRLPALPKRIECIDNSNLQGSHPVAALVVFRNGAPSRNDYRHYNIKTVEGANDYATMKEVVGRRFHKADPATYPDLLLIDGGKGQLNAAREAIQEAGLARQVPLAGIAKRLEEIYLPDDPLPLHISKRSPSLRLLQTLRDEAHRFAVSFHRLKRNKSTLQTALTSIEGIGTGTATKLLKAFGSVKAIREASLEELSAVVGLARATKVHGHFRGAQKAKP
jgi:excinuclease ABC subunit C